MDAAAELAALRTRAYGPDADIHLDPRALARLAELEGFAYPHSTSRMPIDAQAAPEAIAPVAATPLDAPVIPASERRRLKVPTWVLVAAAAVAGIVVGLIAPLVMAPKVVAQLRPTAETGAEFPFSVIAIDPTTLLEYDEFDVARVWSARVDEGIECLFVAVGGLEWFEYSCAPGELDPTVSFTVSDDTEPADFLDLPSGSLVRFVLRDDIVEVWVAESAEQRAISP